MVQQTIDSEFSEYRLQNPENNSPTSDKRPPVRAKKTPLRDLQNENRIVPVSTGSSPSSKDKGPGIDPIKVSGTKRTSPECPVSPSHCQCPSKSAANGHLVYVRRKSKAELGKSSAFDCTSTRQVEEINQQKSPIKESKVSCFPAFAPLPVASLTSLSAKPSVPLPLGKSAMGLIPSEPKQHPVVIAAPLLDSPTGIKKLNWEERYCQLQMLLKKLDQCDQEDYTQEYAIELEKRSIQLSLEEAKEVQRVSILNVLEKTKKVARAPTTQPNQSHK